MTPVICEMNTGRCQALANCRHETALSAQLPLIKVFPGFLRSTAKSRQVSRTTASQFAASGSTVGSAAVNALADDHSVAPGFGQGEKERSTERPFCHAYLVYRAVGMPSFWYDGDRGPYKMPFGRPAASSRAPATLAITCP